MGSAPRTPVPHVCRDMVQWDGGAGAVIAQCCSPLFPNQTWKRVRTGITAERGKWGWFFFPIQLPLPLWLISVFALMRRGFRGMWSWGKAQWL